MTIVAELTILKYWRMRTDVTEHAEHTKHKWGRRPRARAAGSRLINARGRSGRPLRRLVQSAYALPAARPLPARHQGLRQRHRRR